MIARPAPARALSAEAVEFVRFCYARRRVGWPELYDEMCAGAGRGLFRGWSADELAEHGLGLGLSEMARLASVVTEITADDRAAMRAAAAVSRRRAPAAA